MGREDENKMKGSVWKSMRFQQWHRQWRKQRGKSHTSHSAAGLNIFYFRVDEKNIFSKEQQQHRIEHYASETIHYFDNYSGREISKKSFRRRRNSTAIPSPLNTLRFIIRLRLSVDDCSSAANPSSVLNLSSFGR